MICHLWAFFALCSCREPRTYCLISSSDHSGPVTIDLCDPQCGGGNLNKDYILHDIEEIVKETDGIEAGDTLYYNLDSTIYGILDIDTIPAGVAVRICKRGIANVSLAIDRTIENQNILTVIGEADSIESTLNDNKWKLSLTGKGTLMIDNGGGTKLTMTYSGRFSTLNLKERSLQKVILHNKGTLGFFEVDKMEAIQDYTYMLSSQKTINNEVQDYSLIEVHHDEGKELKISYTGEYDPPFDVSYAIKKVVITIESGASGKESRLALNKVDAIRLADIDKFIVSYQSKTEFTVFYYGAGFKSIVIKGTFKSIFDIL